MTEVLVEPCAGAQARVEREMRDIGGGRAGRRADRSRTKLLEQASEPSNESTALFAAISAMVGFLLALNAMLLTSPGATPFRAELRTQGFGPSQVLLISLTGGDSGRRRVGGRRAVGDVLSRTLFHAVPSYLTFAFPIGPYQVIRAATVLLASGAACLRHCSLSLPPILDLRPGRPLDAVLHEAGEAGQGISARMISYRPPLAVRFCSA